ncbi:MAG: lipoyl(octanoyl) transferase LipB [Sphingobacteriia bacterium]|nr:lipoyl(octanoyl) transferase LipB [Sphingobacteriia bacterium]
MTKDIEWIVSNSIEPYIDSINKMENWVLDIKEGNGKEKIWLLEHDDIFTLGTSGNESEVINNGNIKIVQTGRGGKVTYHGPGQRVIYIMLNLKKRMREFDIRKYVYLLECWIIDSLKEIGINGEVREGRIGIWVKTPGKNLPFEEAKIAAIGIRVKQGISYHGVAINIHPDLNKFKQIIPCGLKEFGVTSLSDLNKKITMLDFDKILKNKFENFIQQISS